MVILNNKGHKKLNVRELAVLEYFKSGDSELEAYKKGYPHCRRYNESTIVSQATTFFQKPRMLFYLKRSLPTEKELKVHGADGHPTLYRPRYVQKCYEYFSRPARELVQKTDEGTGEISIEEVVNSLPTRAGFACHIGIPKSTIVGWTKSVNEDGSLKHPDFALAYAMGKEHTETILIENTLRGEYSASFAKFVAANLLDWRDKTDVKTEDTSKPQVQINVNMTKEQAAEVYLEMMKPAIDKK